MRETKAEGISAPYGSLSEDNSYQVAFAYGMYISHCVCFRDELSLLANSTAQDFHWYPLTNKENLTLKKPIRVDIPSCADPQELVLQKCFTHIFKFGLYTRKYPLTGDLLIV